MSCYPLFTLHLIKSEAPKLGILIAPTTREPLFLKTLLSPPYAIERRSRPKRLQIAEGSTPLLGRKNNAPPADSQFRGYIKRIRNNSLLKCL